MEKISSVKLIREEFPDVGLSEHRGMTALDRLQLGSAIARNKGLKPEECNFEFVAY